MPDEAKRDVARAGVPGGRATSDERYDLLILGSGSTAFAAALKPAELGKDCGDDRVANARRHLREPGLLALEEPHRGGAHLLGGPAGS